MLRKKNVSCEIFIALSTVFDKNQVKDNRAQSKLQAVFEKHISNKKQQVY